jgi:predicted dehydrogenase
MVAAAERTGKYLMMGYNNRYRNDTRALKKIIDAGTMGEMYFARCGWVRRRGIPGWGSWFTRKEMAGGGSLIDIGVHALDTTLWLMGMPKPVMVMGSTYAKFGTDPNRGSGGWGSKDMSGVFNVDDLACAMIRFANGATMLLESSWAAHIERDQMFIHVLGTQAGGRIDGNPLQTRVLTEVAGVMQDTTLVLPDPPPGAAHFAEVADFVRCVREKCEPTASGSDGVIVMQILDAIYESAQTGNAVAIAS